MVWNDFHFFSDVLQIQTAVYVLLPEPSTLAACGDEPLPALYLLHGLSDDHTVWLRNTRIAQYARRYRLAVVMPAVNRSFYTDMAHGAKYWSFISEELPRVMESYFPISRAREGRFAAGLSMGGYGAVQLGLRLPHRYAAVAAFSAPLMLHEALDRPHARPGLEQDLMNVFGSREALLEGEGNLTRLADALPAQDAPRMQITCGTADSLFAANEAFVARFGEKLNIDRRWEPGADHTWDYWDKAVREALEWLPLTPLANVW